MSCSTTTATFCAAAVLLTSAVCLSAQVPEDKDEKKEPKRPSLSLKATPGTGMVPVRVSATAEFKGGDDDFQEYYCPTDRVELGRRHVSRKPRPTASRTRPAYRRSNVVTPSRITTSEPAPSALSFRLKIKRPGPDVADDDGSSAWRRILTASARRRGT